jgi:hypothetical protein
MPWWHRIQIHETGTGAVDLTGVAAVVFWLADPVRELYPECFAEAANIAQDARARGIRIVNAPEALSNTIKSVQAQLWAQAGLPCAPATPFHSARQLQAIVQDATFPIIVRPDLLHAQQATFYCESPRDVDIAVFSEGVLPGVVIQFIDTRSKAADGRTGTIWTRFYHKKRALVFGDEVVPNHLFFSCHPICGLKNSTFGRYAGPGNRWAWLARLLPTDRATLAADNRFWQSPPEHVETLRMAVRALGLDFAAVDYSTFADGRPILWEANPYYDLTDPVQGVMPRERRLEARIGGFHRAMARFLGRLLEKAS